MRPDLALFALACPSCPTAQRVFCAVWNDGFWENLAIAVLPFLVIGGITVWAHRNG